MDMVCWSPNKISFMGAAYYIGYGCGFVFFNLPDTLGRRKTLLLSTWIFALGPTLAIMTQGYITRVLGLFITGFMHIKLTVSYILLFELVESKHKAAASSFINAIDCLTMAISALFYSYVSNYWYDLQITMYTIGMSALVLASFLPESPKYLITGGKMQEAIKALNYIAMFNMSKSRIPENATVTLEREQHTTQSRLYDTN